MFKNSHIRLKFLGIQIRIKYYPSKQMMMCQTSRIDSMKYNLGSQRVTVKSTCRHLFCYGQFGKSLRAGAADNTCRKKMSIKSPFK